MSTLYLVRHGQTEWNRVGRFQGHTDIALNALGHREALRVALALAPCGISQIYSSDLSRAVATAQPLAAALGLAVVEQQAWRERSYGIFEGLTREEIESRHPVERAQWLKHDPDFAIEGGESLRQFTERVLACLAALVAADDGRPRCVVAHGGVLDVVYRHIQGIDLSSPRQWTMRNAAINEVRLEAGALTIVRWGDDAHLEDPAL